MNMIMHIGMNILITYWIVFIPIVPPTLFGKNITNGCVLYFVFKLFYSISQDIFGKLGKEAELNYLWMI